MKYRKPFVSYMFLLLSTVPNSIIWVLFVYLIARCNIICRCFWYYVFMGHLHPKQLICKLYIIAVFEKHIYILMYCSKSMLTNYICQYHHIDKCDHDMYVIWSGGVEIICIYAVQKTFSVVHVFAVAQSSQVDDRSYFL